MAMIEWQIRQPLIKRREKELPVQKNCRRYALFATMYDDLNRADWIQCSIYIEGWNDTWYNYEDTDYVG
jgi:hypothetical protein